MAKDKSLLEPGRASLDLLALTAEDAVLVNGRRGMLKPVAPGLAGRGSRRALVNAELGEGKLTAPLRLSWADGTAWELAVPGGEANEPGRSSHKVADGGQWKPQVWVHP